jgi:hypothetical protein
MVTGLSGGSGGIIPQKDEKKKARRDRQSPGQELAPEEKTSIFWGFDFPIRDAV